MMTKMMIGGLVVFASLSACTKTVKQCTKDSDCANIAYPFCDVNGQYEASGGEHDICTIVPPNCPVERCGCQPGATSCASGTLVVCNSDGQTTTSTACDLGCSASNVTCQSFDPFFGTGVVLPDAQVAADVTISSGSTIDSDTGNVRDSNNNAVPIAHRFVAQGTGNDIQVFYAHAFTIDDVRVIGTHPVSFVSAETLLVRGKLDLGARSSQPGPGATTGGCAGKYGTVGNFGSAGGGAGNSTPGGSGDTFIHVSGMPGPTGLPGDTETGFGGLIGGCPGGSDGTNGGGGGGAVQLVSFSNVSIVGAVSVGGGGGSARGGGGSAGNLVIEAPTVSVAGVIAANGGGGGACDSLAADGGFGVSPALGPSCSGSHGGAGAAGTAAPGNGQPGQNHSEAGGGGSLGRMLVRTAAGTFTPGGGSTISVAASLDTLDIH